MNGMNGMERIGDWIGMGKFWKTRSYPLISVRLSRAVRRVVWMKWVERVLGVISEVLAGWREDLEGVFGMDFGGQVS